MEKSVFEFERVADHWYKIEFQNRGAPHVHMLLWVAPEFRENKVVVATLPRETQNNEGRLLKELVTSLQIHSCVERRCKRFPKGELSVHKMLTMISCRYHLFNIQCFLVLKVFKLGSVERQQSFSFLTQIASLYLLLCPTASFDAIVTRKTDVYKACIAWERDHCKFCTRG